MVSIIQYKNRSGVKATSFYFAKKTARLLPNYYLVTLSESLIFLGFSMLLAFDLMGVIWRERKTAQFLRNEIVENVVFSIV